MLVCESKGSGYCGEKGFSFNFIFFLYLVFVIAVLKSFGFCKGEIVC